LYKYIFLLVLTVTGFAKDLEGLHAIVTGGSRGVGAACVLELAKAGAHVAIVVNQDTEEAEEIANRAKQYGVKTAVYACNVSDPQAVQDTVNAVAVNWGAIDILVNAAKVAHRESAEHLSFEDWKRVIDVNLSGCFLFCQAVGRHMIEHRVAGSIVNLSSISAHIVVQPQKQCHYNASKGGIAMLTKSLAVEWAKYGIRVNAVSPGYLEPTVPEPLKQHIPTWLEHIPLKKLGQPEDIASAVLYLIRSPYVTGTDLIVDGGYTAL
jgi:NAD(P)-dependent dehydrogenase (short-subunit alcohol dehydrogenase family)